MKVLILSSNNGGGHNAVAAALQESFLSHGDECVVRDCLSFLSEKLSRRVSRSHDYVYRHMPKLFNSGYRRTEENPDAFKEDHGIRNMIDHGRFELGRYIRSEGFEIVLCTHVFAAMMLTAAKKEYGLPIRSAIVETDYCNTPGSADNEMDLHFLPDIAFAAGLTASGTDKNSIVVSGIPVRKDMLTVEDKSEAKQRLDLPADQPNLLIMGGSMGCGPIPEILERLCSTLKRTVQISVVCGSNERLEKKLASEYVHLPHVHIMGFVRDMSLLYDSADLLVTKPGGITITEAAVKGLPMVLIDAVAGCEAHNLSFFLDKGGAVTGRTVEEICDRCVSLVGDRDALGRIRGSLHRIASRNAAETIYYAMKRLSTSVGEVYSAPYEGYRSR